MFHNDLNVSFGGDSLAIVADTAYAAKIMAKYGINVFGLSWESWGELFNEGGVKDELMEKVKETLWQ